MPVSVNEVTELLQVKWSLLGIQLFWFQLSAVAIYFLVARRLNPFAVSRKKKTRNRIRYARNIAFALFQASIVLFLIGDFDSSQYVMYTLLMSLMIIIPSTIIFQFTGYMIRKSTLSNDKKLDSLTRMKSTNTTDSSMETGN